jgi:hypothetical protein
VSSPRRRRVRRRGHRRQPGGWQTARRWSPAHYLTRATGAQPYHRRDHKRSRPAEGLDRWRTATAVCGSTRGVDKVRDGAQVVRERLWRARRARDPALRGDLPRRRRGEHRDVLDRVCARRRWRVARDLRRLPGTQGGGHGARGDRNFDHRSSIRCAEPVRLRASARPG